MSINVHQDKSEGYGPPPMHAAFVDFSKAFDLVNHEALWEVLEASTPS